MAVIGGSLVALQAIASYGLTASVVALFLTLIPTAIVASFIVWLDRHEPEPPSWLALTFVWGATVAVQIALIGTEPVRAICELAGFAPATADLLSAPIIEEIAKATIVVILALRFRKEFNGRVDGMVYSATVALGFAAVENVFYIAKALTDDGVDMAVWTFFVRGIMSPFAHPIFTAMIGLGVGTAVTSRHKSSWFIWPPLGLLAAMILHLLWNASALSGGFFLLYIFVQMPIFVLMWLLVRWQRKHELALISRYADEFRQAGWMTDQHLSWVGTSAQRRQAREWASAAFGPPGKAQMNRFQHIVADLAYLRDRLVHGTAIQGAEQQQLHLLFELSAARTALEGALTWTAGATTSQHGTQPAGASTPAHFGNNYQPGGNSPYAAHIAAPAAPQTAAAPHWQAQTPPQTQAPVGYATPATPMPGTPPHSAGTPAGASPDFGSHAAGQQGPPQPGLQVPPTGQPGHSAGQTPQAGTPGQPTDHVPDWLDNPHNQQKPPTP